MLRNVYSARRLQKSDNYADGVGSIVLLANVPNTQHRSTMFKGNCISKFCFWSPSTNGLTSNIVRNCALYPVCRIQNLKYTTDTWN